MQELSSEKNNKQFNPVDLNNRTQYISQLREKLRNREQIEDQEISDLQMLCQDVMFEQNFQIKSLLVDKALTNFNDIKTRMHSLDLTDDH